MFIINCYDCNGEIIEQMYLDHMPSKDELPPETVRCDIALPV